MAHQHAQDDHDRDDDPSHHQGLRHDLAVLASLAAKVDRRRVLTLFGGLGLAALAGCGRNGNGSVASTTSSSLATSTSSAGDATSTSLSAADCGTTIPEETAGPYPGDGSNGPNALTESGIVRRDIRSSFGSASGTADGVPLSIELTVVEAGDGCRPFEGAAVYLWHCDRAGRYSMYSSGATNQNYLRGVQVADAAGKVSFTSIFPAAYSGRWPHIHFEVYRTVDEATGGGNPLATSQLAFPEDVCDTVYATDGYEASVTNMGRLSLESDMVFRDGVDQQLATVIGDTGSGYTAKLAVPV